MMTVIGAPRWFEILRSGWSPGDIELGMKVVWHMTTLYRGVVMGIVGPIRKHTLSVAGADGIRYTVDAHMLVPDLDDLGTVLLCIEVLARNSHLPPTKVPRLWYKRDSGEWSLRTSGEQTSLVWGSKPEITNEDDPLVALALALKSTK